ncbi:hypothetical protein CRG98_047871, partial [Punica granatum]
TRGEAERVGSSQLDWAKRVWAESAGLDRHKPKRWAELVRRKTPEKTKMGGDEGSDGREWRFPPLGVATTAREGTGDGGKRCLGYAVLGRGVVWLESIGIERNFGFFFARFSSFPAREFPSLIVGNWGN